MSDPSAIPIPIRAPPAGATLRGGDYLAKIRRTAVIVVFAVAWSLAWALIDRLFPLPAAARDSASGAGIGVMVILLLPMVVMVPHRFDLAAAACRSSGAIVISRPARDSRLAIAHAAGGRGSPPFVDKIVSEASALATTKSAARLVPRQPALKPWASAVVLSITALCFRAAPGLILPTLLRRQFHPFASIAAVTTTHIVVEPGDADVAQEGSITITARATHLGDEPLTIRAEGEGRAFSSQPMTLTGDGRFQFTLSSIDRDWQYDVSGGDALSELYTIRVLRRPAISQFRVQYVYPAYMKRPPATSISSDGALMRPWERRRLST